MTSGGLAAGLIAECSISRSVLIAASGADARDFSTTALRFIAVSISATIASMSDEVLVLVLALVSAVAVIGGDGAGTMTVWASGAELEETGSATRGGGDCMKPPF